jgi:hypothetical protein
MSDKTFRAVVAAVLVGALALATIAVFAALQPPAPSPTPSPPPTASPTPTAPATPVPAPTPTPPQAFGPVEVSGVGDVPQGGSSSSTLVLRFTEPAVNAIPDAPGSFAVTLTDAAGAGTTLGFIGTPTIDAPGSLGVTVELAAPNVLTISIVASDQMNIEPITVTGLGISASGTAALGPLRAIIGDFEGSLAGGVANPDLPSPGTVIAAP